MPLIAPRPFPGLYCPGLIEARRGSRRAPNTSSFPGLYCPGLIEASGMMDKAHANMMFPGLYCPGLIEADYRGNIDGLSNSVSGALLPRPH